MRQSADADRHERVLDAVDAWHGRRREPESSLHEFLGWTWEEYKRHVEDPTYLPPERPGAV